MFKSEEIPQIVLSEAAKAAFEAAIEHRKSVLRKGAALFALLEEQRTVWDHQTALVKQTVEKYYLSPFLLSPLLLIVLFFFIIFILF